MSEPFPFFQNQSTMQYDPSLLSYNLGDLCLTCNKKIIYHESITPCLCYSYAHEKCLSSQLNQINKQQQQIYFKCKNCSYCLQLYEKRDFCFRIQFRMFSTIGLILSFLFIIGYAVYWKLIDVYVDHFLIWLFTTTVFAISSCFFILFSINILIKKTTVFSGIKSTGLELKISAFQNLETFKDEGEEETQTEMVHQY